MTQLNFPLRLFFLIIFCLSTFHGEAQNFKKIKPYTWMIGIHWNIMDDTGDRYGDIFDTKNGWNALPYPSAINVDVYFLKGLSAEFIGGLISTKTLKQ